MDQAQQSQKEHAWPGADYHAKFERFILNSVRENANIILFVMAEEIANDLIQMC